MASSGGAGESVAAVAGAGKLAAPSRHAVRPEAAADIIALLASDGGAPISGAVVPAHGA